MTSLPRYADICYGNINYYVQLFSHNSILIINSE